MRFVFILTALALSAFHLNAAPGAPAAEASLDVPAEVISRVAPVYPRALRAKGIEGKVVVACVIDTEGAVQDAKIATSTNPEFDKVALDAIRKSKFKPGTRNGKPVSSRIEIPFTFLIDTVLDKSPTVSYMPPLGYPEGMSGVKADVIVSLVVSPDGTVSTAEISSSDNPAFNDVAMKTALKMRFNPALKDGKPVWFRASQPFRFRTDWMKNDGITRYGITPGKEPTTGQVTTPSFGQIKNVQLAVFPHALLGKTKTGKAQVVIVVNGKGEAAGIKIVEASAPEFGFAAAAAAETFVFDPAPADKQDYVRAVRYDIEFADTGNNGTSLPPDLALLKRETKKPASISKGGDLDQPLKLRSQRMPSFPLNFELGQKTGEAVIEFLVNEKGNVALPRIVSATSPEFGYAGIQSVSTWRFDPPTAGGKKAVVRVLQPFTFKQPDTKKTESPADAAK